MTRTTLEVSERGIVCEVRFLHDRITVAMVRELEELCDYLDDQSPSAVVVLRGSDGHFCRGIDLSDFSLHRPPDIHGFNKWERSLAALERLKKVTLAVVEGDCRGGGVQVALACDYRLATADATLTVDEVKMGFLPGMATFRLPKHVGMGVARHLVLSGRTVGAEEAQRIGLVHRVCASAALTPEIERTVMEFMPVNGTVVAMARRLLNESYSNSHEDFLGTFLAAQHRAISGESFMRRLQDEALRPPLP